VLRHYSLFLFMFQPFKKEALLSTSFFGIFFAPMNSVD
jgi:hypothetical protein